MPYIQLISSFGWEPIEQVYRQYRQLPRGQYPASEAAKRDYWFSAICTATHRNLGPFFAQWRVPVSPEAQKAATAYPGWLPPEMRWSDKSGQNRVLSFLRHERQPSAC
ncbi:M60 family metallopeptidase [Hymenobacter defluvii]|uniref:M60 family metallopeptidase n=1 Tax=Hymenobacter defluvii TaxID=2054411 RepID=UPI003D7695D2